MNSVHARDPCTVPPEMAGIRRAIHTPWPISRNWNKRGPRGRWSPSESTPHEIAVVRTARLHGGRPALIYLPTGAVDDTPTIIPIFEYAAWPRSTAPRQISFAAWGSGG